MKQVTIITVCYNAAATLAATIESVLAQTYPDIEYVIIDGGSTDGTLDVIDRYHSALARVVSEPDRGIYDAMNKGLAHAHGEIVYFLNADDTLSAPDVIAHVVAAFTGDVDVLYGDLVLYDRSVPRSTPKRYGPLKRSLLLFDSITQQAIFYRRQVFARHGVFDAAYRIVSDYAWLLHALREKSLAVKYLDLPIALFSVDGISCNPRHATLHEEERAAVMRQFFSPVERQLYTWYMALRHRPRLQRAFRWFAGAFVAPFR